MSSSKKNLEVPGFKIDPDTGRYIPVPVNFAAIFSDHHTKRQNQDWNSSRKCNDTHSIQPTKFRKIETGVRKELFKPPVRNTGKVNDISLKDSKSRSSGVRKSLIKSLPSKTDLKKTVGKISEQNELFHMEPISEELERPEKHIKTEGYLFKSPITPHVKFSANPKEEDVKTPDSDESSANFLRLEQLCQSPKNESPVSSVCNMFESNMLLNSEKKNGNKEPTGHKEIISEIRRIIGINQEICQETSSKIKDILELQVRHEENNRKMLNLVDKLENSCKASSIKSDNDEEKENSAIKRRSLRLQNKSPPVNTGRPGPAGSPVILKSGDLRKSTLTKSLVSKCQKYQIDSPRIQKAIDMYNTTRSVCSALLTPKISRSELTAPPKSLNWRSNLSLKVQEQCLMLQDTPVHK